MVAPGKPSSIIKPSIIAGCMVVTISIRVEQESQTVTPLNSQWPKKNLEICVCLLLQRYLNILDQNHSSFSTSWWPGPRTSKTDQTPKTRQIIQIQRQFQPLVLGVCVCVCMLRAPAKDFTGNCSQVIHSITKLFSFLVFFLLGGGSGNKKIGEETQGEHPKKALRCPLNNGVAQWFS